MKIKLTIIALALTGMWACQPELNEFTPTKGNADFTTYLSAGNSLTAGYSDGALYKSGQQNSYAAIIAKQLESVGRTGEFKIPYIETEDGVGFRGAAMFTKLKMGYSVDCKGVASLSPVFANPEATQQELGGFIGTPVSGGPFNNVGVPGAKVTHLLAPHYGDPAGLQTGTANPYFVRFASSTATSVLADALAVNPTFFSLWIGNNDVLGYATSGGAADVITPVDGNPGFGFAASYGYIIQTLKTKASAGVVANIPDITSIPFFTTVPYNAIVLTDQAQVDALNAAYDALYNVGAQELGLPEIIWSLGPNPMVIADASNPLTMRQITSDELVLLTIPQDSLKCGGWGSQKPVPNQFVLTATEKAFVTDAVSAYNQIIKSVAEVNDLAFVDANDYMKQASDTGIKVDGVTFSNAFVRGNLFSTDGVHLTPQGNALVANLFIDAINAKYSASIPKVNVNEYNAVLLP
jgi:lysophospholipase L1-like esterase